MKTLVELKVNQEEIKITQEVILKKIGGTLSLPTEHAMLDSAPLMSLVDFQKFDASLKEDSKFKQLVGNGTTHVKTAF